MNEHVVVVNEQNQPLTTVPKSQVHSSATPLHRGFSVFVFNRQGHLLLQQRARSKKTWPLVWSNSCCGHPLLDESNERAAKRRLRDELGLTIETISTLLPDYRYRAEKDGVVENEFCPVMVSFTDQVPQLNPQEVEAVRWVDWQSFVTEVRQFPERYSPWCTEETLLLDRHPPFRQLYRVNTGRARQR